MNIPVKNLLNLSYAELVMYLKAKYGRVPGDYMILNSKNNYVRNPNLSRTKEGLMIHHVLENQFIYLGNSKTCSEMTKTHPETQKADNLVYCDYIEHLLLHIKITEETVATYKVCGWGGIFSIMKHINSAYNYYYIQGDTTYTMIGSHGEFRINCTKKIIDNLNDYLMIVDYIMNNTMSLIIRYSQGLHKIQDLWVTYDEASSFIIVKNRILHHPNYIKLCKELKEAEDLANYSSLNELYAANFGLLM